MTEDAWTVEALEKKRKQLEDGNNRSYNELRQKVAEVFKTEFTMDTGDMRRELLLEHLLIWGVITPKQALEFEVAFHTKVELALNKQWEEVRKTQKPALAIVKNPEGLVDKHGRPLT